MVNGSRNKVLFLVGSRRHLLATWMILAIIQWDFQGPPMMGPLSKTIPIPLPVQNS